MPPARSCERGGSLGNAPNWSGRRFASARERRFFHILERFGRGGVRRRHGRIGYPTREQIAFPDVWQWEQAVQSDPIGTWGRRCGASPHQYTHQDPYLAGRKHRIPNVPPLVRTLLWPDQRRGTGWGASDRSPGPPGDVVPPTGRETGAKKRDFEPLRARGSLQSGANRPGTFSVYACAARD